MGNRANQQQTRGGTGNRVAGSEARRSGGLLRQLFGPRSSTTLGSPAPSQFGHFADTWMSRLLIGAALLLLAVMFPLQWLHTPTLAVRANLSTFAPHPGAAPDVNNGTAGSVTASYDLSEEATISARIYDGQGALVKTLLLDQKESAGPHFVLWDGTTDNGALAADGPYRIDITARGAAQSASGSVTVAVDTTPPSVKLVNLDDGAKLKTSDLVVQGITEAGATVQFADSAASVTADSGGGFTLHRQLVHGTNTFKVLVRDASGNLTTVSRSVDLLDRPPAIKIESPADGAWTNQKLLTVSGVVDPGSTVRVNNQDVVPGPDGRFHVDTVLDEGANNIAVEATDPVGNKARVEDHVSLDTRPPPVQIDSLADGTTVRESQVHVYGRTDPGVKLSVQGRQVGVDAQGHFDSAVDLVAGDNTVHVEAQDQAGNLTALDRKVRYDFNTSSLPDLPITGTVTALALIVLGWVLFGGLFSSVSLKLATDRPALPAARYGSAPAERLLITYSLSKRARTSLQVVDSRGHLVAPLLRAAPRAAGDHQLLWDGTDLHGDAAPPGAYLIQAQARSLVSAVSTSAPISIVGAGGRTGVRVGGYGSYGDYGPPPPPAAPPPARHTYGYGERAPGAGDPPPAPPERNRLRGDRG